MRGALVTALLLACAGCSPGSDRQQAEAAAARFHAQLDAGAFQAIYDAASPELRERQPAAEFVAQLARVHATLGETRASTLQGWKVVYGLRSAFLTLGYVTEFAHGKADEQFVYRVRGHEVALQAWHIESATLSREQAVTAALRRAPTAAPQR